MNEYRVDLKVRNNLLLSAIENAGFKNVSQFCKASGLQPTIVGEFVNFKTSPLAKDGSLTPTARRIADLLGVLPDELWTEDQLTMKLDSNQTRFTVSHKELALTLARHTGELLEAPEPDAALEEKDKAVLVHDALDSLRPIEARVLRMRFGIGTTEHTLEEVAKKLGVTRERIRQIEAKGLRLLRAPERSKPLRPYISPLVGIDFEEIKRAYENANRPETEDEQRSDADGA